MSTIKTEFHAFVQEIRSHKGNATSEQIGGWATTLMEFQNKLKNSSVKKITENLGVYEYQIFTLLGLGKDNKNSADEYKVVLDIIANHPGKSGGIAVVEFLKSPEGFALMNTPSSKVIDMLNGPSGQEAQNVLETFLGGAFGLDLATTIVKSVKAEEIGTLLTYAWSGNYEFDQVEYNKDPSEDRFAFILRKAKTADVEFALDTSTNNSFHTVEGRVTKQNRSNSNGVRGRLRPDHFISNFNTHQTYVTNTTTDLDKSEQGVSFLNYYLAAVRYTKTPFVNGCNNPVYGHQINAAYLSSGLFPQDSHEESGVARDFVKYVNRSELKSQEKRDLAQMEFLGLLGNCTTAEHAAILFAHNPVIAGCDTLDLFFLSLKVSDCLHSGDRKGCNDLIVSTVSKKLKNVANHAATMLESNILAEALDNGHYLDTNTHFKYLLTNLTQVVDQLPQVFDMMDYQPLKEELVDSLYRLINAARPSHVSSLGGLVGTLKKRVDTFAKSSPVPDEPDYNQMTGVFDLFKETPVHHSHIHTNTFKEVHALGDVNFAQLAQDFFGVYDQAEDLHPKGQFKSAFQEYLSALEQHETKSNILLVANEKGLALWGDDKHAPENTIKPAFGSVSSLRNTAGKFAKDLESAGYPLMGEFVRKTRFLLGVDNEDGVIKISDLHKKSVAEFIAFINRVYTENGPNVAGQYKSKKM